MKKIVYKIIYCNAKLGSIYLQNNDQFSLNAKWKKVNIILDDITKSDVHIHRFDNIIKY